MFYVMCDEKSVGVAPTVADAVAVARRVKASDMFTAIMGAPCDDYYWIADADGIAVDCPEI